MMWLNSGRPFPSPVPPILVLDVGMATALLDYSHSAAARACADVACIVDLIVIPRCVFDRFHTSSKG